MSSHVKDIAGSTKAVISKVIELGKPAVVEALTHPKAVVIGLVIGLLTALVLKVIF